MLDSIITSKTRIKLLLKFFMNPGTQAYLRGLANEFGESTNAIRVELNRLTKAKLLKSSNEGRTVQYLANKDHSLFKDLQSVVKKYVGIDKTGGGTGGQNWEISTQPMSSVIMPGASIPV